MAKKGIVTTGEVAFCNITEHDTYKGKSTGNYTITITLSDSEARKLADMGVQVKEYTNNETGVTKLQRKFKTQYHVPVVDLEGHPVAGEIPYGSTVRVLWTAGEPSEDYGTPTYLQRIRVVEMSESDTSVPEEF